MTPTPPPGPDRPKQAARKRWRAADLRGAARLATQATMGVTRIVEGVHRSVLGTLGLPGAAAPGRTRGITGMVYRSIQGVTLGVDAALQAALRRLEPWLERAQGAPDESAEAERDAVLAALNGVLGDRLAADDNPLALPMALRQHGRALELAALHAQGAATGRVLLLIHGLCMNDRQWLRSGHDHGAHLARTLSYTPVYLRYNTGLHISVNGRALAQHLEALLASWPVPVQELGILAHSMGGLVARSAVWHATQTGQRWPAQLRHLIFLGAPHHGAPLARAGPWVDLLLASTPYSRPFTRLGHLRSAGISDLRYGHVLDADWQGRDRLARSPDTRTPVPLPDGVACHAVAATLAAQHSPLAERLVGDGLVPLRSALGAHDDPARCLAFAPADQYVVARRGHLDLLSDAAVARQLVRWLTPPGERDPATATAER